MIRNYIFDLYGTLVDIHTDETDLKLWQRMALLYAFSGARYAPGEMYKAYQAAIESLVAEAQARCPDVPKEHIEPDILQVFRRLYEKKDVQVSDEMVEHAALFFRTLSLSRIWLYPDAMKVVKGLKEKGCGVYLLTNAQAAFTRPELKAIGLDTLFDGIVISSEVGLKKPAPAIFEHLLKTYALDPAECLMIGNDLGDDIKPAHNLGVHSRYIHTQQSPSRPAYLPGTCQEIKALSELV